MEDMGLNITFLDMKALILNVTKEAAILKQENECKTYGTFMSDFGSHHLEGIFWGFFAIVVLLLCVASYSYAKSEKSHLFDKFHPDAASLKKKHQRTRLNAVFITTGCFLATLLCVGMEALAGCALYYCHQHKTINFYWAMWGLTQVGSLIAILGVTLHQWASLKEQNPPPWNIALGTPILVITAGAWFVGSWIRKKLASRTESEKENAEAEDSEPNVGMIHGVASDGSLIVQFPGKEWEQIPGFRVTSRARHGGATGQLTISAAPSIELSRPVSEMTLETGSTKPISTFNETQSSDAADRGFIHN